MEMKKEIELSLELIDQVTDSLYKQDVKNGYMQLNEAIVHITKAITLVFEYNKNNEGFIIEEGKIVETFSQALSAMESKDTILLADVLQYEITEQFNDILGQLQ